MHRMHGTLTISPEFYKNVKSLQTNVWNAQRWLNEVKETQFRWAEGSAHSLSPNITKAGYSADCEILL